MMYISYQQGGINKQVELHFDDGSALIDLKHENFKVTSVQADGDELEAIKDTFTNIPMSKNRVVRWDGEMASFIIVNYPANYKKKVVV